MSRFPALATALGSLVALPVLSGSSAVAAVDRVVSIPVAFSVVNQNRSAAGCPADGRVYTVRGHLSGPASALTGDRAGAVSVYLHGNSIDERLWRYTGAQGYNHVIEMARQGFVSVSVTRLGYDDDEAPHGKAICWGSEADIAHQIIGQLRAGAYRSQGVSPAFDRVALVGHSASGFVAMSEAYSFRDIDALIVVASGEFVTPRVAEVVADQQVRCATSDDGYERIYTDDDAFAAEFFFDGEPAIVADVVKARPADSCAGASFAPVSIATDLAMLGTVDIPVLTIGGAEDTYFPDPDAQARLFTGSPDVTAVTLPGMGHAIVLERSARAFRTALADWLRQRSFAS